MAARRADFLRGSVRVVTLFFRPVIPPKTLHTNDPNSFSALVLETIRGSVRRDPAQHSAEQNAHQFRISRVENMTSSCAAACAWSPFSSASSNCRNKKQQQDVRLARQ